MGLNDLVICDEILPEPNPAPKFGPMSCAVTQTPGFRVALAIASLPGMTMYVLCRLVEGIAALKKDFSPEFI
jgi:hypothetical protein